MALVSRLLFTAATVRPRCEEKGEGQRPGFSGGEEASPRGGRAGRDHDTAWPAARGKAAGEGVPRLWWDEAKALRARVRRESHCSLDTWGEEASKTHRPRGPPAATTQHATRGVVVVAVVRGAPSRMRALAPPPGPAPPRPLACAAPPRARLSERRLAHAGPAEHWLPEPHRARVGVVVAGARL